MKQKRIVHVLVPDKFGLPFIQFINKEFNTGEHIFLCTVKPPDSLLLTNANILFLHSPYRKNMIKNFLLFKKCIQQAGKIIMHGIPALFYFLFFPQAIKKIYWIILGYELGDSSVAAENEKSNSWQSRIKDFVLQKVYGHITHIKGDSVLANFQFGSAAKFFYSPIYLSNVVPEYTAENFTTVNRPGVKKILVGNSTCPTNDHASIFKMLLPYRENDILIYCPLSYGNYPGYKEEVVKEGHLLFGNKFIPVNNFMQPDEYKHFLEEIDIAVFNHKRQEAMGVTLALINMGKVIYMNSQTTAFASLNKRGIKVFDNRLVENEGLFAERNISTNNAAVYAEYNYTKLKNSLEIIFNN